ncbi:16S rRNA (uracil(1498)-N(3))-methyltransferase [Candidatus Mycoplasma pogonae]
MRFFVSQKKDDYFVLSSETIKHLKVARVGQDFFICVYQNQFYKCILENNHAKIVEQLSQNHEYNHSVIIAASLINIKRFEWLIQKACELGATQLIPVLSEHVVHKISGSIDKKMERWNQIAIAAAEQSFRNKAMEILAPERFENVINFEIGHKFIAHEKADSEAIITSFPTNTIFLVGPEGGFSENEIELAKSKNFKVISLGKRILRAETAAIYLLSRVNE